MSAIITYVELGSIAQDLGWQPGDEIVSINGHTLRDIIDFRFYSSDELIDVVIRRGNDTAEFEIEKDFDMPLGVEFEDILFDGIRTCGAHCIFCFVEQLPKGLRKPLYLKDDDYRLSFLHGNFVTLGNVSDEELDRIVTQRLSPLYISVHTTEQSLREKMLGRAAPNILAQIDRLSQGRIALQTQIVLCRGVNDGEHLDRAIEDLSARYPTVGSIAIVPAGLSLHRKNTTPIGSIDADYSAALLKKLKTWQHKFLATHGTRLVWMADEFYLNAGKPVPTASAYEGFPQIENGIGLVRQFQDSAVRAKRIMPQVLAKPVRISLATGMLPAPLLQKWADSLNCPNLRVQVIPIRNRLFGESVTVAGLISGNDIIDQLKTADLGDALFVPSVSARDGAFLDDVTLEQMEQALGVNVIAIKPRPYQLIRSIVELI